MDNSKFKEGQIVKDIPAIAGVWKLLYRVETYNDNVWMCEHICGNEVYKKHKKIDWTLDKTTTVLYGEELAFILLQCENSNG